MKKVILLLTVLLVGTPLVRAQETTFHITVLAYQWTTTHNTLTFTYPGYANTSCNGIANMNAYASGGNISATGTTSSTCSTNYTPPSSRNIDIQKPVVFILAESETSRMVLTCTRNVRWSQCHALNPGQFMARNDNGHFEVEAALGKGKEEWVKFEVVQQTAIQKQQPQTVSAPAIVTATTYCQAHPQSTWYQGGRYVPCSEILNQTAPVAEASASIEAPKTATSDAKSGFPNRWKSMTTGTVSTLRYEGEYIYGEVVLSEAAAKAGMFFLTETRKDGDKYVGKTNGRVVKTEGGPSCTVTWPIEFTLVTPDRIEGRSFTPPVNATIDWNTCSYTPPADWQSFVWIPVR